MTSLPENKLAERRTSESARRVEFVVVVNSRGGVDDEMDHINLEKSHCSLVMLPFSLSLFISFCLSRFSPFPLSMDYEPRFAYISLIEQIPITMLKNSTETFVANRKKTRYLYICAKKNTYTNSKQMKEVEERQLLYRKHI